MLPTKLFDNLNTVTLISCVIYLLYSSIEEKHMNVWKLKKKKIHFRFDIRQS